MHSGQIRMGAWIWSIGVYTVPNTVVPTLPSFKRAGAGTGLRKNLYFQFLYTRIKHMYCSYIRKHPGPADPPHYTTLGEGQLLNTARISRP